MPGDSLGGSPARPLMRKESVGFRMEEKKEASPHRQANSLVELGAHLPGNTQDFEKWGVALLFELEGMQGDGPFF